MEETTKTDEILKTTEENQEPEKPFDYRKEREERVKRKAEKAVLNEFGVNSFDEIKEKLSSIDDYQKQIDALKSEINKSKINEYKLEVLKNGFDEKFVDFIAHELNGKVSENEDFSNVLSKFKEENPQFLKSQENGIKFSTAPNFESKVQQPINSYELMDNLIRRKNK